MGYNQRKCKTRNSNGFTLTYKPKKENEKKLKKWLLEKYTNQVGGERLT